MVNRRIASGTTSYLSSLPGVEAGREPTSQEVAWACEQATVAPAVWCGVEGCG